MLWCCWVCLSCACLFFHIKFGVVIRQRANECLVDCRDKNAWEMDKEDLLRWNGLLEYATAQALDEGQDEENEHTVLSELAASIASHNTSLMFNTSPLPANSTALSSPPTRLADFLLTALTSSFSAGSCTQLPQSVLEFVNDAMREFYPPRPRDTMVFLWTARAVTCAVEACPRELIEPLLGGEGGIGEGVSVWIADECKAWSVDQLGYDVSFYSLMLSSVLRSFSGVDNPIISTHPHSDPRAPAYTVNNLCFCVNHCFTFRWAGGCAACCEGCV